MKYLGVTSQAEGGQQDHTQSLLTNINSLYHQLSSCHLTQYQVHIYQQCDITPKLGYPLVESLMSNKELYIAFTNTFIP